MRQAAALLLFMACAPVLCAQDAPGPRRVTVLTGIGNSLGWFGGQAERYLGDRFSVFAGLGYTPPLDGTPSGITGAGGARLFTRGEKHRGFVELSVSQIAAETGLDRRLYGPGIQGGWQFTTRGGFTLMLSGGAGYILADDIAHRIQPLMGMGLGYTWRESPP